MTSEQIKNFRDKGDRNLYLLDAYVNYNNHIISVGLSQISTNMESVSVLIEKKSATVVSKS